MSATLPTEARDLLGVVLASIDIPCPATVGDVARHQIQLREGLAQLLDLAAQVERDAADHLSVHNQGVDDDAAVVHRDVIDQLNRARLRVEGADLLTGCAVI